MNIKSAKKASAKQLKHEASQACHPKEIVAAALNEHGYLLHHRVVDVLHSHYRKWEFCHFWSIEASELPVSLPNGAETRIDLVLRTEGAHSGHGALASLFSRATTWNNLVTEDHAERPHEA